jgi:hypothetical protein
MFLADGEAAFHEVFHVRQGHPRGGYLVSRRYSKTTFARLGRNQWLSDTS